MAWETTKNGFKAVWPVTMRSSDGWCCCPTRIVLVVVILWCSRLCSPFSVAGFASKPLKRLMVCHISTMELTWYVAGIKIVFGFDYHSDGMVQVHDYGNHAIYFLTRKPTRFYGGIDYHLSKWVDMTFSYHGYHPARLSYCSTVPACQVAGPNLSRVDTTPAIPSNKQYDPL